MFVMIYCRFLSFHDDIDQNHFEINTSLKRIVFGLFAVEFNVTLIAPCTFVGKHYLIILTKSNVVIVRTTRVYKKKEKNYLKINNGGVTSKHYVRFVRNTDQSDGVRFN